MRALTLILGAAAVIGAAACAGESAIVAATASEANRTPSSWTLTDDQASELGAWLRQNRSKFGPNLATPPVASLTVVVRFADGRTRVLEFFDQPGWANATLLDGRIAAFPAGEVATLRERLAPASPTSPLPPGHNGD